MIVGGGFNLAEVSRVVTGGLVTAIWQGIVLSIAAWCVLRMLPRTPAAVRFAIWFGVFAVVAALPFAGLLHRVGAAVPAHSAWLTIDARWCLVVAGVWALASVIRAVTLLLAVVRVRSLWKRATPLQLDGVNFNAPMLDTEAGVAGVTGSLATGRTEERFSARRAELCVSDEVDRPTVIGFFAPKILIPSWLVAKLTTAELEQIVLHEAGHLGRADDWMNLLQKIALVVFPLNPALAWVERRLCFERELACDERVLKATRAPKAYAACLATLAEYRLGRRGLALALGALGRESELGRRVGRILTRREMMKPRAAKLVLGGAMLALLTAAAGLERCPQVVGFAATPTVREVAALPMPLGEGIAGRYGYQPVVFHPRSHQQQLVLHRPARPHAVYETAPATVGGDFVVSAKRPANPAYAMRNVSLRTPAGANGVKASRAADTSQQIDRPVVQWVVVTTWQRADGARLVLTTEETVDAKNRIVRTQSVSDTAPSPEQVYPYAAVPVRDGWLVFEL